MTVKYSQDLVKSVNPCRKKTCKACGLFLNQKPIFDEQKISNIFWVGLSAVQFSETEKMEPLSALTPTGALIQSIEAPYIDSISFYKTNLVKCLPLKDDRIRYPLEHEMEKCFPNFQDELQSLQPRTVFLLGSQVANFVFKKFSMGKPILVPDFGYIPFRYNNVDFVPVHHPSYILVYKRKLIEKYQQGIQRLFDKKAPDFQCVTTYNNMSSSLRLALR